MYSTRRGTSTVPSFIVKQPQVCNLFWCFLRGLRVRGVTPHTQWIKNSIWVNVISIWVGFHTPKFLFLRVGKNRSAQKHHSKACNTTSLQSIPSDKPSQDVVLTLRIAHFWLLGIQHLKDKRWTLFKQKNIYSKAWWRGFRLVKRPGKYFTN